MDEKMRTPQIKSLFTGRIDYETRTPWLTAELREKDEKFNKPVKEFLTKELAGIGDEKILDIGSGVFSDTYLPDSKREQTTRTDFVKIETEDKQKIVNVSADNLSSVFGETSFGAVIMKQVYTHLENPNKSLEEINKVLRKGGLFFLIDWEEAEQVSLGEGISDRVPEMVTSFNSDAMMKEFEKFGFEATKKQILVKKTSPGFDYEIFLTAVVGKKK